MGQGKREIALYMTFAWHQIDDIKVILHWHIWHTCLLFVSFSASYMASLNCYSTLPSFVWNFSIWPCSVAFFEGLVTRTNTLFFVA